MRKPFTVSDAARSKDGNWGRWDNMTDYMRYMITLAMNGWGDVMEVDGGGKRYLSGEHTVAEWTPDGNLMVHDSDTFWGAAQANRGSLDPSLLPN